MFEPHLDFCQSCRSRNFLLGPWVTSSDDMHRLMTPAGFRLFDLYGPARHEAHPGPGMGLSLDQAQGSVYTRNGAPPGQGSGFLPRVDSAATSGSFRNVSCGPCSAARESAPRMLWGQYPNVSRGVSGLVQATSDGQCLTAVAVGTDCSVGLGARVVTADCGGPCSSSTQHWRRVGRWLQLVKKGTNSSLGGVQGLCLTADKSSTDTADQLLGVSVRCSRCECRQNANPQHPPTVGSSNPRDARRAA